MSGIYGTAFEDIIVIDELSVDGTLYINNMRNDEIRGHYREELFNTLDNYAKEQGFQTYEVKWNGEITWEDGVDAAIVIGKGATTIHSQKEVKL